MDFVSIKPLSVNQCWQGKRYKTDLYTKYEHDVLFLLPRLTLPLPPYKLELVFGVSSLLSDVDNPVKPTIDCLQKKYKFNDKLINELIVKKLMAPKGKEYFGFKISSLK